MASPYPSPPTQMNIINSEHGPAIVPSVAKKPSPIVRLRLCLKKSTIPSPPRPPKEGRPPDCHLRTFLKDRPSSSDPCPKKIMSLPTESPYSLQNDFLSNIIHIIQPFHMKNVDYRFKKHDLFLSIGQQNHAFILVAIDNLFLPINYRNIGGTSSKPTPYT